MNEKYISIPQVPMNKLQLADKKERVTRLQMPIILEGKSCLDF